MRASRRTGSASNLRGCASTPPSSARSLSADVDITDGCARSGVRDVAADIRGRIYEDRRHGVYAGLRSRNRPAPIGRTAVKLG
jgi:hypothetical protein